MDFTNLIAFLAMAPQQTPPGTQPNPTGEMIKMIGMIGLFIAIFYFVAIRPQNKRNRQQEDMRKSARAGDKILTGGGIIATIVTVKEKSLTIRSADAKMEISKTAIAEVIERSGEASES